MSHTPGEWFLHVNQAHNDFSITNEDDDVVIASTPIRNIDDVYLLAAAPELLEALKLYQNTIAALREVPVLIAEKLALAHVMADKAISKAEGK